MKTKTKRKTKMKMMRRLLSPMTLTVRHGLQQEHAQSTSSDNTVEDQQVTNRGFFIVCTFMYPWVLGQVLWSTWGYLGRYLEVTVRDRKSPTFFFAILSLSLAWDAFRYFVTLGKYLWKEQPQSFPDTNFQYSWVLVNTYQQDLWVYLWATDRKRPSSLQISERWRGSPLWEARDSATKLSDGLKSVRGQKVNCPNQMSITGDARIGRLLQRKTREPCSRVIVVSSETFVSRCGQNRHFALANISRCHFRLSRLANTMTNVGDSSQKWRVTESSHIPNQIGRI